MALIRCPECEGKVSDKAHVCIHCGYPLHEENHEQFCPYCGRSNASESSFCAYCGKDFSRGGSREIAVTSEAENVSTDIMKHAEKAVSVAPAVYIPESQWMESSYAPPVQANDQPRCPRCGSASLSVDRKGFGFGKAAIGAVVAGPIGLLAGGIGAKGVVVVCMNCGHKYTPEKRER